MYIAIDVGNSNIVVGILKKGSNEILHSLRISTYPYGTSDELMLKLNAFLKYSGLQLTDLHGAIVSSVVPVQSEIIAESLQKLKISPLYYADAKAPLSFIISVPQPEQVGADRLVNAEAALKIYGSPCIVLDSCTATTLCAINEKNQYLGGAILPGLELSMQALAQKTAKLFTVDLTPPKHAIGNNTQDAIRSGLLFGYSEMLTGLIERFKSELHTDQKIKVIATGGISSRLKDLLPSVDYFDPDLTLKGLGFIYESISN